MKNRAKKVSRNERKIMNAATQLWKDLSIREITLDSIADMAEVSVRTLIRKYGSKEGLIEECIKKDAGEIEKRRNEAEVGNIPNIIDHLMHEYEEFGNAIIRTLAVEDDLKIAKRLVQEGRRYHMNWCAHVFSPFLPEEDEKTYNEKLLSFYAATDLYLWKLIRKDLQQSKESCKAVYLNLILGLSKTH